MAPIVTLSDLPMDLKNRILYHVPLDDMLTSVQDAMSSDDVRLNIYERIQALRPLRDAWVDNQKMEVRNRPMFRSREARAEVTPRDFVRLERLVIGSAGLAGTLSPAIAELRWSLRVLHCDANKLDRLPDELGLCERLAVLDASSNLFTHVPAVVGKLRRLRLLTFSENKALGPEVPEGLLGGLPRLSHVGFFGCALTALPEDLVDIIAHQEESFFANVSYNPFPPKYIENLCDRYAKFRSRVLVV